MLLNEALTVKVLFLCKKLSNIMDKNGIFPQAVTAS